jgi:hypothetical protein
VETKAYTLDFGSKVTYHQIQDGGSRHYEKIQTVITSQFSSESHEIGSRYPINLKNAIPEVTDCFQDGRRRHFGNSSECYKMGNCHPT